ncbi:MAG: ABC transporter ATP-binding protein, partial [Acidobacteria bacterium]|nr:ABC transporter ATP-binding protein [Acidobacteriota bacterium]
MSFIELEGVTKYYKDTVRALDGVSFTVGQGEWMAIMGPSGSGKTTLLNILGCLDQPTSGRVRIGGSETARMNRAELTRFRAEMVGFIFQQFHLIPYLTALENVMMAQYFHSMTDEGEALEALDRVGLKARARHLPSQLSGGEQQRVSIARALINQPK